jgi:nicotinate-nucleotide adenylyltransferase
MTVLATAANPAFSVSRVDVDRAGPTYTRDTLVDLLGEHGADTELFFITGADALAQILTWRDPEEMFRLAHFVGVSLVEIPALAISSSDCRARVRAGAPIWYLVPDAVVRYVEKRRLYSEGSS